MKNSIDFSKLEQIVPRKNSWELVCKRLDSKNIVSPKKNILPFYVMIPLAASFIFITLSVLITAINHINQIPISIEELASSDISSWYESLGNETSDDLETLDDSLTMSYLFKEN